MKKCMMYRGMKGINGRISIKNMMGAIYRKLLLYVFFTLRILKRLMVNFKVYIILYL